MQSTFAKFRPLLVKCTRNSFARNVSAVSRTRVSAQLWSKIKTLKSYKKNASRAPLESDLVERSPSDSRSSIELPLASDPDLAVEYRSCFRGGVRFGKILEDIDSFAAYIALAHCDDGNPNTTSNMRTLTLRHQDMILQGCVTWAGRTSLQVNIELLATDVPPADALQLSGSLVFVSVGRDGKGMPLNPLVPRTDQERRLCAEGEVAQAKRKYKRSTCLRTLAPTQEESERLHQTMTSAALQGKGVPMLATQMQSVHLMQPQERNFYGKIFGGFLMREAYDLAFAAACAFSAESAGDDRGGFPTIVAADDVTFNRPVNVGDVVSMVARVVYTGANEHLLAPVGAKETSLYQVRVDIGIIDLRSGKRSVSNEFHFTFISRAPPTKPGEEEEFRAVRVPPVLPTTYQEGMEWLGGRRRMLDSLRYAEELGSYAAQPSAYPSAVKN